MRKLQLEELGRPELSEYQSIEKIPVVVILDNIRSGLNVGSFFRTSDAFKIEKIYLCGITARPPHKEILKTAIGATSSVEWEHAEDVVAIAQKMRAEGRSIVGIEQTSDSVLISEYQVDPEAKYALIFGNEVEGVSEEVLPELDTAIEIPQYGTKHSLNVSVCGGIVLWKFASPFLS